MFVTVIVNHTACPIFAPDTFAVFVTPRSLVGTAEIVTGGNTAVLFAVRVSVGKSVMLPVALITEPGVHAITPVTIITPD